MSGWRTYRIADLGRVVTGKTPPSSQPELFDGTIPFLTPSDMSFDRRHSSTERFVSADWDSKGRTLLPEGAVCVVCIGATIGKICMSSQPTQTNQQLNSVIVDPARFDSGFVYYVLRTKADELKARAAGAATPIINKTAFSELEIDAPPLAAQRNIASILGAYDDLIEVNRRRIAVLEEIARGLFEEWFVRFRFPGHEAVPILDTPGGPLPEGWSWTPLAKLAQFKSGNNKLTKAAYRENGVIAYSASGPDGFVDHAEGHGPAVIVGAVGAYCGKSWLADGEWTAIANTFALLPNQSVPAEFLFLAMYGIEKWPRRGAAQPFIAKTDAGTKTLPHPPQEIWALFARSVGPIFKFISALRASNRNLAASRDLLLPRLISGQLSVTDAERQLEEAA